MWNSSEMYQKSACFETVVWPECYDYLVSAYKSLVPSPLATVFTNSLSFIINNL